MSQIFLCPNNPFHQCLFVHSSMFLIKLIQSTWKNIHSKVLMIWKAYQKENRNKIHTTGSIPVFKIIVEFLHHRSCFQQGTLWRATHSDQELDIFTWITKNDFKGLPSSAPPILQGNIISVTPKYLKSKISISFKFTVTFFFFNKISHPCDRQGFRANPLNQIPQKYHHTCVPTMYWKRKFIKNAKTVVCWMRWKSKIN